MQRLRRFLSAVLREDRIGDAEGLRPFGARGRWVPEELMEFDEVEYALPLGDGRDLTVSIAVEDGRIGRLVLGWVPGGDDDADARALSEGEIAAALGERGDDLVACLEFLTAAVPE